MDAQNDCFMIKSGVLLSLSPWNFHRVEMELDLNLRVKLEGV